MKFYRNFPKGLSKSTIETPSSDKIIKYMQFVKYGNIA